METKDRAITRWSGIHKGFSWEVVNSGPSYDGHEGWCSYVYIPERHKDYPDLLERLWTNKKTVYSWGTIFEVHPLLQDLPWNGGQTYYHQVTDNDRRYIKIGDDYQHSWDSESKPYNSQFIIGNVKNVIDSLVLELGAPNEEVKS